MPRRLPLLISLLLALPGAAVAADPPPPREDHCRAAIQAGLETLRNPLPDGRPRDETDRKRLLAEMETLVESSRRQGLSECQTWSRMMGKAFNQ